MTGAPRETELTPVKRALLEIRELKAQVATLERAAREPVAIVGMGVRFPGGANSVAAFERLLWSGTDAITPIPEDRWAIDALYDEDADAPGRMITRHGGFLDQVDQFDAEFFGISPREAASMDPQQRLVLEVAWEALEDAGFAPSTLAGTQTGVYLGIANSDYGRRLFAQPALIDAYFSPGNAFSVAAGRLSYFLGTHGPSIAVDTACSSSLVALHLACQALRLGECDRALAGGVNLILTPELNINFSKARMMAPNGRCKTFDAAADGYVRGEGCGMVVLRRLSDAQASGDRILAVIRGSAINQDGRSGGLTAPNGPAQEAVIRAALEAAAVAPTTVGYVEAHGTGTPLGDPIEVNALHAVLSDGRDAANPLALGSVKTNVGHLEAAAGIAGVIKTVLALRRREIPPHLHLQTKNPHIDWASLPITIPTAVTPWAPIAGRRVAGVSSFGFSGTNAHVILEEAPSIDASASAVVVAGTNAATFTERPLHVLTVSARDAGALATLASQYAKALDAADDSAPDVCFTANVGRTHFAHRLSVRGATSRELRHGLDAFVTGEASAAVTSGIASAPPRVAFLFSGQGPQYAGMSRALYDVAPVFREAFDRCAALLDARLPRPIKPVVFPAPGTATPLDDTAYAQPALFAVQYALSALWRSWGVEPYAVMGHSFGEYAAACVAGAISLEDAVHLVVERGRLVQALPSDGSMAVIGADDAAVAAAIADLRAEAIVSIAAINGAENTVISGARDAVDTITARFAAQGIRVKPLRVSHAFHSPLVEPALPAFEQAAASVRFAAPRVTLISNLTGQSAGVDVIGHASYWRDHMRHPVRFAESIGVLGTLGVTHFVELSPHPVLLGMGAECLPGDGRAWLPSLREGQSEWSVILESLQTLYAAGVDVDWSAFDAGHARRRVSLATYPFRRRRHWIDVEQTTAASVESATARWARLGDALRRDADRGPLDLDLASYPDKWRCLTRMTTAHAVQTLRDAGVFVRPAERHTVDSALAASGIATSYRHLVRRWLDRLVDDGALRRDGEAYVADAALGDPRIDALWREAEGLFATDDGVLAYVRHCGALIGSVLGGRESPLETLFPGGSFDLAAGLYERSGMMKYVNHLAASAVATLATTVPAGRMLRVLEVGAGTGGTTASVVPALPADRVRYRFTDVSDAFLDRARERFAEHAFVEYGQFDADQALSAQGYFDAQFDVIVAANAIHATRDLRAALDRLRTLLAPGGVLLLVESTRHLDWFDMTTGLIEGWQHFADDLRGDNPLLSPPAWLDALRSAGFADAAAWPAAGAPAELLGQHVIVALAPGDAAATGISTAVSAVSAPTRPVAEAVGGNGGDTPISLGARILAAGRGERLDLLRAFVREHVMQVLRFDASEAPARSDRLMDLGFDSLMAVQLRNRLGSGLGLERALPATLMFDHPTIDALAAYLLERLAPQDPTSVPTTPLATAQEVTSIGAAAVAAMSEEEVEALLIERLARDGQ